VFRPARHGPIDDASGPGLTRGHVVFGLLWQRAGRGKLSDEGPGRSGEVVVGRLVAWLGWALALAACPVALIAVGLAFERNEPAYLEPRPWPARLADGLIWGHLLASLAAAVAVCWLTRDWRWRLVCWGAILALLPVAWLIYFVACVVTTGMNL
jgi:hypothetical protein